MSPSACPILYSFRRCPYAMRARMTLLCAGIQCEVREVDLKHKPQALRDISAKATVPVLHLPDGRVIDESLDIMRWALSLNDPEQWFTPSVGSLNEMTALIHRNDSEFKHHLDRYKYQQRYADQQGAIQGAAIQNGANYFRQACDFLTGLEQRLAQFEFLFGDMASMADVALFPFVRQFAAVDRTAFDTLPLPHLQQWLSGWVDDERFRAIMIKRKVWHTGAEFSLLMA